MQLFQRMIIILLMITCARSKIIVQTSSTVNLTENSPVKTSVVSLSSQFHGVTRKDHFQLLNLQGFERRLFRIENGNVYTNDLIDREELLQKNYCLDSSYCEIELQILVNDVSSYLIVPIHVLDENDNEPVFRGKEMEMKLNENEMLNNFYQLPFEGAKDVDEKRKENEIIYQISCSNLSNHLDLILKNDSMCLLYFQVIILSQSNGRYDRLALRVHRSLFSSFDNLPNALQLEISAKNRNEVHRRSSLKIHLHLKRKQKQTLIKCSSDRYEFVVLLNSSLLQSKETNLFIGKVSIVSSEKVDLGRVSYEIVSLNRLHQKKIEMNSMNGDVYLNLNEINSNDHQIQFSVQVSSSSSSFSSLHSLSKFSFENCEVKVLIRYSSLLGELSLDYAIHEPNLVKQINHTNAFLIDEPFFEHGEKRNLFQLWISSQIYPNDQFDVFLHNFHDLFTLLPSSSVSSKTKLSIYSIEMKENINRTRSIYNLNISIEHQLTQLRLTHIQIQLIFLFDSSSSSTTTSTTTTTTSSSSTTKSQTMSRSSFVRFRITNQTNEFCVRNQSFVLLNNSSNVRQGEGEEEREKIGLLRVIDKSDAILINNQTVDVIYLVNDNEIIVNECRMIIENGSVDHSLFDSQYQLCSSSSLALMSQCLNIRRIINQSDLIGERSESVRWLLRNESVRLLMLILSSIFLFVLILLVLFICYLKNDRLSSKLNKCFSYQKTIKQQQQQHHHQPPYSLSVNKRMVEFPVYSAEANESENADGSYLYQNENDFQQEPLPSLSLSSLSSTLTYSMRQKDQAISEEPAMPVRTSSCSSFLQETKQLLDMITSSPPPSKLST